MPSVIDWCGFRRNAGDGARANEPAHSQQRSGRAVKLDPSAGRTCRASGGLYRLDASIRLRMEGSFNDPSRASGAIPGWGWSSCRHRRRSEPRNGQWRDDSRWLVAALGQNSSA